MIGLHTAKFEREAAGPVRRADAVAKMFRRVERWSPWVRSDLAREAEDHKRSLRDYQIVQDMPPTQYPLTPKKNGGRFKIIETFFLSQSVHTNGNVFHDTSGPNLGQTLKTLWFVLNETCMVTHLPDYCGTQHENVLLGPGWEKYRIRNASSFYSYWCTWMTNKWRQESKNLSPMWKKLMKTG